ncbi:MAG: sulfatase, partial [Pirellulales bacterium]
NVLLIVTDDMDTHLGCYGHPEIDTPSIDRLAQRGMRFDRAYCQVALCNPSRVSFLSGLSPDKTGVHTLGTPTRQFLGDAVMLPETFRKKGYFTAQSGKIFHTGEGHEDPRSWNVEYREFGKRPPMEEILRSGHPKGPIKHTSDWAQLKTPDAETPDGIVARRAARLIEQSVAEEKSFFLGVGFRRPHAPYAAPKAYFDLYPPDSIELPPSPPAGYLDSLPHAAFNYAPPPHPLTPKEQRELIAAYYACNSFVDAQIAVLLNTLDRLDLWKNTVIVFFGDHGYHLGDHGGIWHKNSLFEEATRVPLIVVAPHQKAAGKSCQRLVELIDVYPTLTSLCDLPTPEGLDGKSFAPLLSDPNLPWKQAAYSSIARGENLGRRVEKIKFLGKSVRTERYRYTEWDGGKEGVELYDHQHDPHEWVNLAQDPKYATTVAEMHRLLLAGQTVPPR